MVELLAQCPAHQALHRVANAGVSQVRQHRSAYIHPAFHLSVYPSSESQLRAVMAGTGLR